MDIITNGTPAQEGAGSQPAPTTLEQASDAFRSQFMAAPDPVQPVTPMVTPETLVPVTTDSIPAVTEVRPSEVAHPETVVAKPDDMQVRYDNLRAYANRVANDNQKANKELEQLRKASVVPTPVTTVPIPDDFTEAFYDDPKGTMQSIIAQTTKAAEEAAYARAVADMEARMDTRLAPVDQRESEARQASDWAKTIEEFEGKHADYKAMWPEMAIYLQGRELLGAEDKASAMQDAYFYTRGVRYTEKTPDQLLEDPNVRSAFMQNEAFRQQILAEQIIATRATGAMLPKQIGEGVGMAPAMPAQKPTNIAEASALLMERFGRGMA